MRFWNMAKHEIKKLVRIQGKGYHHYMPCGLNIRDKLWWWLVPGVIIKVRWPRGMIVIDHDDPRWVDLGGATRVEIDSADPNDHYRPWLEANVGKQKWHWDWGFVGNDVNENCLTIKIVRSKTICATMVTMLWT